MSLYGGGNDACHPCLVQFPLAISRLSVVLQSPKNARHWFMFARMKLVSDHFGISFICPRTGTYLCTPYINMP
jgi:hypothetical protein